MKTIELKNGPVAFIEIDDDVAHNVALGRFFDHIAGLIIYFFEVWTTSITGCCGT